MATATSHSEQIDVHKKLRWLRHFARLSDSAFQIPGTRINIGLDAIIGLIPGIGDVATAAASFYMIDQARQLGVRKTILARMIGNVTIDAVVGAIPLFGDIFDVGWKANTRNLRLLEAELGADFVSDPDAVSVSRLKVHEHV